MRGTDGQRSTPGADTRHVEPVSCEEEGDGADSPQRHRGSDDEPAPEEAGYGHGV